MTRLEIEVTEHAVSRLRRRRPDTRLARQLIVDEVRSALAAGRVATAKPREFRLYRERRRAGLPKGQRFVWTEDGSLGFIVQREGEASVVVLTTLTRSWGEAA